MSYLNVEAYDRYVYENELKNFLPTNFIDFHVHAFRSDYERYGVVSKNKVSWVSMIASEMTVEQLNDTLAQLFPENHVTPLIFGCTGRNLQQTNDYIYKVGKEFNYPTLYRTDYLTSGEEMEEEILKGGYLWIKPYLTNRPAYIPAAETRIFDFVTHEQLRVLDKHGWILMLHIPRNGRLKDPVNLAQLMEIEQKYPNIKLIIAHIGRAYAKEDIGNAFDLIGKGENTYFDFTANLCDDAIKACIEAVGTKKLIYGTDLPYALMRMYRIVENGEYINIVRRGEYGDITNVPHMRETDEKDVTLMIYEQIRALKRCAVDMKLTDTQIEDIMNNNAQRLIDAVRA